MKIVVVSLFDGMSCGRIALDRTPKLNVKRYYSSEIDKYAIQIADKNYPQDTKHRLGNVIDINGKTLGKKIRKKFGKKMKIILIGGSPCQGFSNAGKRKGSATSCGIDVTSLEQYLTLKEEGFEFDGQSYLFWEYVRIWKELKPDLFFLENVRVTKKWLPMFNETMGVEPISINSALVSAQNRVRFYWTNIPNLTQPEDKGILLKDILESGAVDRNKSLCVTTRVAGATEKHYKEKRMHQMVIERPCTLKDFNENSTCHHVANADDINGNESIKRVYNETGKAPTLTTMQGGHREPKVLIVPEATKKGYTEIQDGDCFDNCQPNSKTRRGRNMKDKSNALLTSNGFCRYEHPTYRKLTPVECERLQTLDNNYTEGVSNSQRYKMVGNGWTIV